MNAHLILGIALLTVIPGSAQSTRSPIPVQTEKDAVPVCPAGKGCLTFKQMWEGGDAVAKSATWACFVQKNLGIIPSYNDWNPDDLLLLRDGVSVFEMHRFIDGTERLSSSAEAESFRDGIAHWRPVSGPTSLDVTKSGETLALNLKYTDTKNSDVRFHFDMRLSSGRFTSKWIVESKSLLSKSTSTEDYSGQCIPLPKQTKQLEGHK